MVALLARKLASSMDWVRRGYSRRDVTMSESSSAVIDPSRSHFGEHRLLAERLSPGRRDAYLDEACGGDSGLRADV